MDNVRQEVFAIAQSLNPDFSKEALTKLMQGSSRETEDYTYLLTVLRAEQTTDFFRPGHFPDTVAKKDDYNYERSVLISAAMGIVFPPEKYEGFPETVPAFSNLKQVGKELENEGYSVLSNALSHEQCDAIIKQLSKVDFKVRKKLGSIKGFVPSQALQINGNTCWVRDQQDILAIPEVQKIAFDPNLLRIVQSYFKANPILAQTNCWWSVKYSTDQTALSGSAQQYHQDKGFIKFLKVFIYLKDVTPKNGPHIYVPGSAVDYEEKMPTDYTLSSRVEDEYIEQSFGAERIKTLTGTKGTVIIEDTNGFHKGQPVKDGYRLLLQFEYCSTLYFNPLPSFSQDDLIPPFSEASSMRLFQNFSKDRYLRDRKAHRRKELKTDLRAQLVNLKRRIFN